MRTLPKQTKAFTMIELVFVIVVLGILAALALPRIERDIRQEAGDNILSAIRYTQHLALNDDKTNPFGGNWQKSLWQIRFTGTTTISYTIGTNMDYATDAAIDKEESAIDPISGKYIFNQSPTSPQTNESPDIFLTQKYGINSISFNCPHGTATSPKHIAFDNLGRPHRGISTATNNYASYNDDDCTITFGFESSNIENLVIFIAQETGYAYILDQNAS